MNTFTFTLRYAGKTPIVVIVKAENAREARANLCAAYSTSLATIANGATRQPHTTEYL